VGVLHISVFEKGPPDSRQGCARAQELV